MPRFSAYQGAQRRARLAAGSLADQGVKAILEDLRREVARLSAQLASLPVGTPQARVRAIEASVQIVDAMHQRLLVAGNRAVAGRRSVAFNEIAAIWQEAAERTARAQGIPLAKLGAIRQPPLTLLGSYESLGGAASTWRTALRRSVEASRVDLNVIVREAIGAQVSPEVLARQLRPYVVGAEPFHKAFGEAVVSRVQDLRPSLPPGTREAGRTMAYHARRIAYSEIHNARAEAEVTHFAVDPLVEMIHWTLSPFRGQVAVPDVCDMLATANWYGLGPGMYPVGKVPVPPHPFDRCERMPVTRSAAELDQPKPNPVRQLAGAQARVPSLFRGSVTAAQEQRVREQAETVMRATDAWAAQSGMDTLTMVPALIASGR